MSLNVPVMPKQWPPVKRDLPITQRENVMLALNHEKPMWMPNLYVESQAVNSALCREVGARTCDGVDWFGTYYKYEESQKGTTPMPGLFNDISEWKEKFIAPDMSQIDWKGEAANFKRDPSKALYMRMSNGTWERLHICEGFEQALIDLISEPEACREFFEYVTDYKIELFNRMNDAYHFDYIVAADDYGTMRAPFFSVELFEETLLQPQKRFVAAVHEKGVKFVHHCCGVIEHFFPDFVNEIGYDAYEIQPINRLTMLQETYGKPICFNYRLPPEIMYNPASTVEQARAAAREMVDKYGAQVVEGPGCWTSIATDREDLYYAVEEEIFNYSFEKYKNLKR